MNIVVAGFFYQYARNNPDLVANDGRNCYARESSYEATHKYEPETGRQNVTKQFEKWFFFGFLFSVANIVAAMMKFFAAAFEIGFLVICSVCIQFTFSCGGIAWIITGSVLRWRHVGQVCAGSYVGTEYDPGDVLPDERAYMIKSGNFMTWYLFITFFIAGCGIVCVCANYFYSEGGL